MNLKAIINQINTHKEVCNNCFHGLASSGDEVDQKVRDLALVVQRLDNAIHRINHYPVDSVVCFVNTYPLDSDLSGGQRYPAFEQPGPDVLNPGLCVQNKNKVIVLQYMGSINYGQQTTFNIVKFSMAARLRGHKQRKLHDHVYLFLLFVSSRPHYQAEF